MEGKINAKTIFDRALKYGSLADKDGWEKSIGKVLLEATISFLKPKFKVDPDQFINDQYVNYYSLFISYFLNFYQCKGTF